MNRSVRWGGGGGIINNEHLQLRLAVLVVVSTTAKTIIQCNLQHFTCNTKCYKAVTKLLLFSVKCYVEMDMYMYE